MTPALHIRFASAADASDIAAMSRSLIERGLPWTWRSDRIARAIAAQDMNVAIIRERGDLLAFGIMEYLDSDAYLALLAVRQSRCRQGIGSAVLEWLEVSATVAGAERIRLEARRDNSGARCFYNEHGYHEVRIVPNRYAGVIDGVCLEKWLRANGGSDV